MYTVYDVRVITVTSPVACYVCSISCLFCHTGEFAMTEQQQNRPAVTTINNSTNSMLTACVLPVAYVFSSACVFHTALHSAVQQQ
jgi:hypothetical protein